MPFFYSFWSNFGLFEDFSNLTEKQQLKPKNSCSLTFFASFGTQLDPRSARLLDSHVQSYKKYWSSCCEYPVTSQDPIIPNSCHLSCHKYQSYYSYVISCYLSSPILTKVLTEVTKVCHLSKQDFSQILSPLTPIFIKALKLQYLISYYIDKILSPLTPILTKALKLLWLIPF